MDTQQTDDAAATQGGLGSYDDQGGPAQESFVTLLSRVGVPSARFVLKPRSLAVELPGGSSDGHATAKLQGPQAANERPPIARRGPETLANLAAPRRRC
jgi:hypothetical protein